MNFLDEYFKYEIGTEISGLTNELNIFFVEKLSQKYDRNIIVLTSSLFEANKIYDELVKIHENTLLFPMDENPFFLLPFIQYFVALYVHNRYHRNHI